MVSTSSRSNATAGAHDIGDGIGRADFVEVDLFDGDLVDLRFGFPQAAEHGDGIFFGARGKRGLFDHLDDVREVAMGVGFLGRDVVLGGADAVPFDLFEGNDRAGFERSDGGGDGVGIRAGIGQRAHKHVAANARERIQIASERHRFHCSGLKSSSGILAVCLNLRDNQARSAIPESV